MYLKWEIAHLRSKYCTNPRVVDIMIIKGEIMKKKQIFGIIILLAILFSLWIWTKNISTDFSEQNNFLITALPVGKADSLILQENQTAILVDTGEREDGLFIEQELKNRGIEKLDLLFVTHFDKDHVGSAAYLLERIKVDTVLMPDYAGERPEYQEFLDSLNHHSEIKQIRVTEPLLLDYGAVKMTIYPAEDAQEIQNTEGEYDNDMSLVASVIYGDKKFFLTGDIEKTRISQMLSMDIDWKHDWIKMPHHGKYQKALKDLLDVVQPDFAVICCSREEPAEKKTLKLLAEEKITTWDTSSRSVVTICDGEKIKVEYH